MSVCIWQCEACGHLNEENISPHEWLACSQCSEWRPVPRRADPPPPSSVMPPIPDIPRDEYEFVPNSGGLRFPPQRILKDRGRSCESSPSPSDSPPAPLLTAGWFIFAGVLVFLLIFSLICWLGL